jgi:xylulokinase
MQAMADILDIRIEVPKNPQHAGAVGGAYCALIGLGLVRDFEEADKKITAERVFLPQEEYREMYDRQYAVYKEIFPRTQDLFDTLAAAG